MLIQNQSSRSTRLIIIDTTTFRCKFSFKI